MFESGVRIVDGNVMTASEKKRVLLITKGFFLKLYLRWTLKIDLI